MIQCLKCNRVWPTGTIWCGTCKATLGVKLCPDGHVNQPISQCCTTCGKIPLSPFCPCRKLRTAVVCSIGFVLVLSLPFLWAVVTNFFDTIMRRAILPCLGGLYDVLVLVMLLFVVGGKSPFASLSKLVRWVGRNFAKALRLVSKLR